ncbi:hypothetical protein BST61_g2896 [Cercospora zeina]
MGERKFEKDSRIDYRATWKRRLLSGAAARAVVGVAATAARFAIRSQFDTWWEEGRSFTVTPSTEGLSREDQVERRSLWYGRVYYLPPGVQKGGLLSTLAAGIVCAIVGGMAFFPIVAATGKMHTRSFRAVWAGWLGIGVLASLIAFVWSFAEFYTSSTVDVDGFFAAGPRERPAGGSFGEPPFTHDGTYSIESWSCQIGPIWEFSRTSVEGSRFSTVPPCEDAKISRWLMLALFLLSAVLLALTTFLPPWQSKEAQRTGQGLEMAGADGRRVSDRTGEVSRSSSKTGTAV